MPKIRKETIDEIRQLGAQGYTNTEIGERLSVSRGTARKYRVDTGPSLVQVDSGKVSLSLGNDVTKILYDLMGVMSTPSIIGAVKQSYLDTVALTKLKVTHWPVYSEEGEAFTAETMIERLVGFIAYLEKAAIEDRTAIREAEAEIERGKELAEERYKEGYTKASRDYSIFVPCIHCGIPCRVKQRSPAHRAISEMLTEGDWGHDRCANRAQYESERGTRELEAALRY